MDVHEHDDSDKVTGDVLRRPRLRFFAVAGLTAATFAVLAILVWDIGPFRTSHDEEPGNCFPSGVLADYVPEDSAAAIGVHLRQLLESSIGQRHLRRWLQQFVVRWERQLPWLEPAGIDLIDDLDNLLISIPSTGNGEAILLARGRFEPSRFHIVPDFFEQKKLDRFSVWEYRDRPAKKTTWLAPVGDMLAVSDTRNRVQAALKQARDPQPLSVRSVKLREMLTKVDRQQSLWLAASVKELGATSGIDSYLLKMILRPLLTHAESVYGGITCTEDIRAELHFGAATEEDASQLEVALKSICEAAPGVELLGRQSELLPLMRLLGASQFQREGKSILLRCRLTADGMDTNP